MEPFYFGPEQGLFGAYHAPHDGASVARPFGVVLCQPVGQEYMRAHRAFVQLARGVALAGMPALRFDHHACGDSAGDSDAGSLRRWREDVVTAIDELEEGSDVESVVLIGLRLGGSLAALAASGRRDVRAVVLWDPVVRGKAHVDELAAQHRTWLSGSMARSRRAASRGAPTTGASRELMGFPLTEALADELGSIDLMQIAARPADRVLLVDTSAGAELALLASRLSELGAAVDHWKKTVPPVWMKVKSGDEFSAGLVPRELLDDVVGWCAGLSR